MTKNNNNKTASKHTHEQRGQNIIIWEKYKKIVTYFVKKSNWL